jgi:hypothetical protein
MSTAYGEEVTHQTALKNLKRWRVIQLASVLPLLLCVVWIFYYREASGLGVMAFFLILVVGVMFPEVKGDIAHIHVVLKEEHQVLHQEIQQLFTEELRKFLSEPVIQELLKGNSVSPGNPKS